GRDVLEAHRDHAAPLGGGGAYAGADEPERGGEDDREADVHRELRQDRRDGVREGVAADDRQITDAAHARGLAVTRAAHRDDLAAHQPKVDRNVDERDGRDDALNALPEDRDQRDREDKDRKGLQHVRGPDDAIARKGAQPAGGLIVPNQ